MIENSKNGNSIGSLYKSLKKGKEGAVTIYFQTDSPGKEKEGNWLPTPNGPFYTVLRIYGPGENELNGTYQLPKINKFEKQ